MIHNRLNSILKKRCMSGYRLSKMTDISQEQIWKYRNGMAKPRIENLIKIADALDVKVDDLLERGE